MQQYEGFLKEVTCIGNYLTPFEKIRYCWRDFSRILSKMHDVYGAGESGYHRRDVKSLRINEIFRSFNKRLIFTRWDEEQTSWAFKRVGRDFVAKDWRGMWSQRHFLVQTSQIFVQNMVNYPTICKSKLSEYTLFRLFCCFKANLSIFILALYYEWFKTIMR